MNYLLLLLLTISCTTPFTVPDKAPGLSPETFYKRDMIIEYDDVEYEGVAVLPMKAKYSFHLYAQGDLDLFTFTTCHREETAEDASNVTKRGLFWRKIEKKREIKLEYTPNDIEKTGGCPVYLGGFEKEKGRHSWGLIDFATPEATLPALIKCNGKSVQSQGVSICQARNGLLQSITFALPVRVLPRSGCELGKQDGTHFEFAIQKGQCVYAFVTMEGRIHRLTTLGYEAVPIRK